MTIHEVYVSIGSNVHPKRQVISAVNALAECYNEVTVSSIYESRPIGFSGANFYNLVACFQTENPVGEVVKNLKQIEIDHGRKRVGTKFSDRTLDIDLLLFDNLLGEFSGVRLPREEITQYAFVLCPLAEIASEVLHPKLKLSYQQLWSDFDKTKQLLWPVDFDWDELEKKSKM